MSENKKLNGAETTEVSGGKMIETNCYKCEKKISLRVADPPLCGFPAPICRKCLKKEKKTEMKLDELEKVSGGLSDEEKKNLHDSIEKMIASQGYQDMTCQFCGKTFPYSKFLLYDWNGIDLDGRYHYATHTCPECKEKHPFVSRLKFGEAISKEDLAKVSGGGTTVKVPEEFYKHFKEVTRKCRMCGKEFTREQYTGPIGIAAIAPQVKRLNYYFDLCDACAKKYPYKGPFEWIADAMPKNKSES